jgi:hypothetical protein
MLSNDGIDDEPGIIDRLFEIDELTALEKTWIEMIYI